MDPSTALLIAAAIAIALYLAAARIPLTKCMRCGGRGVLRSWLLPWRFRPSPLTPPTGAAPAAPAPRTAPGTPPAARPPPARPAAPPH